MSNDEAVRVNIESFGPLAAYLARKGVERLRTEATAKITDAAVGGNAGLPHSATGPKTGSSSRSKAAAAATTDGNDDSGDESGSDVQDVSTDDLVKEGVDQLKASSRILLAEMRRLDSGGSASLAEWLRRHDDLFVGHEALIGFVCDSLPRTRGAICNVFILSVFQFITSICTADTLSRFGMSRTMANRASPFLNRDPAQPERRFLYTPFPRIVILAAFATLDTPVLFRHVARLTANIAHTVDPSGARKLQEEARLVDAFSRVVSQVHAQKDRVPEQLAHEMAELLTEIALRAKDCPVEYKEFGRDGPSMVSMYGDLLFLELARSGVNLQRLSTPISSRFWEKVAAAFVGATGKSAAAEDRRGSAVARWLSENGSEEGGVDPRAYQEYVRTGEWKGRQQ